MVARVDAKEAQRLMADGVPFVDVLPADVFVQEHLPGARNVPLATFEPSQVDSLDRAEPLLIYCFDQHWDLGSRAACRFEQLGFQSVYELVGGRAAWTALGLPTEGAVGDRRRISQYVAKVPTLDIGSTVADLAALGEQRWPTPVLNDDGVLLGAVYPTASTLPPSTPIEQVMVPAPGTIRPELRIDEVLERLDRDGLDHVFVTAVDGVLLGLVITEELHV